LVQEMQERKYNGKTNLIIVNWEDNDEKNIGHTGDEDCSANEEASTDHQGTTAKSLKCFYTNAGSVLQKMAELKEQIKVQNADIVAVIETWAHAGIGDSELALEEFVAYRVDRREQRGGGVILYVKDTLRHSSLTP